MNTKEKEYLIKAKQRSRKVMLFYLHLASYIIFISLIVYNLYIVKYYKFKPKYYFSLVCFYDYSWIGHF